MTNAERADRLLAIAGAIGDEMRLAAGHGHWNLAVRRAQEVVADVRAPAFSQEISVHEGQARTAVAGAEKVLTLAADLLVRLRRPGT